MLPLRQMTPLCVILLLIAPKEARQHSYQNQVLDALQKHPSFWPHQNPLSQEFQPYQASQDNRQQLKPNSIFQSDQQSSNYLNNFYLPELLSASQSQQRYHVKPSKHDLDNQRTSKYQSSPSGVFKLVDKLKANLPKLEAVAHNKGYPSKASDKHKSVKIKVPNHQSLLSPIYHRSKLVPKEQDDVRWAELLAVPNSDQSTPDMHDVDTAVLQLIAKDQVNAFLNAELKDLSNTGYEGSRKSTKVRIYGKKDAETRRVCVQATCIVVPNPPSYSYVYPYYYPYYYYPAYYYYPYGYYRRR